MTNDVMHVCPSAAGCRGNTKYLKIRLCSGTVSNIRSGCVENLTDRYLSNTKRVTSCSPWPNLDGLNASYAWQSELSVQLYTQEMAYANCG
jgi:hypothetical protein